MDLTPIRNRLLPRFRFVWSSRSTPKARWLGGVVGLQVSGGGYVVVTLAWRAALLWLASVSLAGYFVGAAALAFMFSRNHYNRITYLDLVLPTRWQEAKVKRGQSLIDEGLHQMQARKYGAGIMLMARGLQLAPRNIPARMVLGEVYVRAGYLYKGLQMFRDGIPYAGGKKRYLDTCFRLATYLEDYDRVLAMVKEARSTVDPHDQVMLRYLRTQQVNALVKLGRYAEVVDIWNQGRNNPSLSLNAAWARAMAGLGQGDQAIAAVEKTPGDYGVLDEPYRLLMDLARECHRPDVGRRAADQLAALDSGSYQYQVDRLVYLAEIKDDAGLRSAADLFYLRFGLSDSARVTLLKSLEPAATGPVLEVMWSHVTAIGRISIPERIAYVQDLIAAGDLAEANREFAKTAQLLSADNSGYGGWVDGTRVLLDLLQTGAVSSRSQLQAFCNNHPLGPDAFRLLIGCLVRADRLDAARDILALARNRYPSIQRLPVIEPAEPDARELAAAGKGSEAPKIVVSNPEGRTELTAMRADLAAQRWSSALTRIAKVEKSPFAKELGDELLYDRIIIHGNLSNQTELSWYTRRLFEQSRFDPARLRTIAQTLYATDHADSALTLLREILREHPEARWAADLRQTWQKELKAAPLEGITKPGKTD